jgi:hypothetical protein
MKKPTKQNCIDFLNKIADIKKWDPQYEGGEPIDTYYSKTDGSYICFVNNAEDVAWMIKKGITDEIQSINDGKVACIGFNPLEQKWYGWSHRAVYGFGIGSECKKGDCGYVPTDLNDFLERSINFWSDDAHTNVSAIPAVNDKGIHGAQVTWEYVPEFVPNKNLHGTIGETFVYPPQKYGKGEWVATSMEDAKQMAIDFAEGVS